MGAPEPGCGGGEGSSLFHSVIFNSVVTVVRDGMLLLSRSKCYVSVHERLATG